MLFNTTLEAIEMLPNLRTSNSYALRLKKIHLFKNFKPVVLKKRTNKAVTRELIGGFVYS